MFSVNGFVESEPPTTRTGLPERRRMPESERLAIQVAVDRFVESGVRCVRRDFDDAAECHRVYQYLKNMTTRYRGGDEITVSRRVLSVYLIRKRSKR